ncbi:MAG: hypothetical protein M1826_006474 [Phylliscum demangeonii]|nr:MAG: hypothetical protein M1826_006474 [Phylliscum demangeonii]
METGRLMETYHGQVRTPTDAIILFEACRLGLLPRVQRRLSEKERQSIRSGSVFVWDEREAGMRRWTDGKSWSASRVSGSFLTYREMEGKRGGAAFAAAPVAATAAAAARTRAGQTPDSTRGSDSDLDMADEHQDGYRYKADGLMKQSFSITTSTGQHLHLISYYSRAHPAAAALIQPSTDANLRPIRPQKGMYPESTVHEAGHASAAGGRAPLASPRALGHFPPAAFARSAATHPASYAVTSAGAAYAWPPSPLPSPTQLYANGLYGGGAGTAVNGSSPAAGPPSPLPYHAGLALDHHSPAPAPPPLPDPPPSMLPPRSAAAASSDSLSRMARYIPTSSPHQMSPTSIPTPMPAGKMALDPRLMAMAMAMPGGGGGGTAAGGGGGGGAYQARPKSASRTPPQHPSPSSPSACEPLASSSIPSFGRLINGSGLLDDGAGSGSGSAYGSVYSYGSGYGSAYGRGSRPGSSRSGSHSPGGGIPRDIPSEKMGFMGEDARAIRVLDRAFYA